MADAPDVEAPPPAIAVIGYGYLGTRIAAELLLLGSPVAVYDSTAALLKPAVGQAKLDEGIGRVLKECHARGLLEIAGATAPRRESFTADDSSAARLLLQDYHGPSVGPSSVRWASSIRDAVHDADIVVEAVPDNIAIKTAVFAEVVQAAPPKALLATSTLSLPLRALHAAVNAKIGSKHHDVSMRLMGLRFLAPVVFIAFAEVTITAEQVRAGCDALVADLLGRWRKSAFACELQGAVETADFNPSFVSTLRWRLDTETALQRQRSEARLRRAVRQGPEALAAFDWAAEELCCICLTDPANTRNIVCGHTALCASCAKVVRARKLFCPICRSPFMSPLEVTDTSVRADDFPQGGTLLQEWANALSGFFAASG